VEPPRSQEQTIEAQKKEAAKVEKNKNNYHRLGRSCTNRE